MGKLEDESARRTRKTKLKTAILTSLVLGAAGVLNGAALARAVLREMKIPKEKRKAAMSSIWQARGRLAKQGLLEFGDGFWQITEAGRKYLEFATLSPESIDKPRKWDRKWRILIFDIPEGRKGLRDKTRNTLRSLGFKLLQKSVWVYPYNCEDLVALMKADFKIGKDLIYIIADEIENDGRLCKEFGLQ